MWGQNQEALGSGNNSHTTACLSPGISMVLCGLGVLGVGKARSKHTLGDHEAPT